MAIYKKNQLNNGKIYYNLMQIKLKLWQTVIQQQTENNGDKTLTYTAIHHVY